MAVDVFGALVDQLAETIAQRVIDKIEAHLMQQQDSGPHDAYRVDQVAQMIGLSPREVRRRIVAGELASITVGRARLVTRQAISDFLERRAA